MSSSAATVSARAAIKMPRWRKWSRRLFWATGLVGVTAAATEVATDNSLSRSLRAITAFFRVISMYKFETPETTQEYFAMHQRAADSILYVCLANEGLYVKLGQGLNAMSHILPKEYTNTLKVLLDDAKPVAMPQVRQTIEEETGRRLEDIFERFDEVPVASASIAQVHKAWLKNPANREQWGGGGQGDGEPPPPLLPSIPVAVKVRKPCIGKQSKWDIYTFQFFSYTVEHLFGLPTEWSRKTVVDGLKREMDFTIEVANAEQFRQNFKNDPQVYIPVTYNDLSSTRLLVMEWVDAAKLSETDKICANFDEKAVLRKLFDAVGDMIFKHSFVHCDPHAANVLVRHMPDAVPAAAADMVAAGGGKPAGASAPASPSQSAVDRNRLLSSKQDVSAVMQQQQQQQQQSPKTTRKGKKDFQIVLLDFGLSVPETERFRMQYALLFKSLVTRDMDSLKKVVTDWGISDPEIFASMQMQKPIKSLCSGSYDEVTRDEVRQMQMDAHSRLKSFMINEAKIPRELPMVGRSIDILRGINRLYGSPINRVNMFVQSAVDALGPLHDYEGVQRYLARIRKLVMETKAKENAAAASTTPRGGKQHNSDGDLVSRVSGSPSQHGGGEGQQWEEEESHFASVYDDGALRLRREQAAAMKEIEAERNGSLVSRAANDLGSLYRAFLFHLVMFNFSLMHNLMRWYNQLLRLLFPEETSAKLTATLFEDRLERMEHSMRVE